MFLVLRAIPAAMASSEQQRQQDTLAQQGECAKPPSNPAAAPHF
jgi:hypothetical protein